MINKEKKSVTVKSVRLNQTDLDNFGKCKKINSYYNDSYLLKRGPVAVLCIHGRLEVLRKDLKQAEGQEKAVVQAKIDEVLRLKFEIDIK